MKPYSTLLTIAALVLAGCVPSVHGIADREHSVMDSRLEGVWVREFPQVDDAKSRGRWEFTPRPEDVSYRLNYRDASGNTGEFTARLTQIGAHHYLDLFPVRPHRLDEIDAADLSGFYRHHLLPVHTFIRINQWAPTLELAFLDLRRMDRYLEDHPESIAHERTDVNGDLLLTASPRELRDFIEQVEDREQIFTIPIVLKRE